MAIMSFSVETLVKSMSYQEMGKALILIHKRRKEIEERAKNLPPNVRELIEKGQEMRAIVEFKKCSGPMTLEQAKHVIECVTKQ